MFALEWCEFCWAVRKLLTAMEIEYHSVDLDAVDFQADDRGGNIRKVLTAELGVSTIPQIYIGGEHIGGASDLFAAFADGELQSRLRAINLAFDDSSISDVNSFMPQWLQPRKSA
jgi:cysteine synthase A